MGAKYLLPCTCGKALVVEASQSGLPVTCGCGQQFEVPTHRGLQQLRRADETGGSTAVAASSGWSRRQGMLFLAAVLVIAAGALWWWAHTRIPPDPVLTAIKSAQAQDLLFFWDLLRSGVDVGMSEQGKDLHKLSENIRFWKLAAYAIAVAGLAVGASGFLTQSRKIG